MTKLRFSSLLALLAIPVCGADEKPLTIGWANLQWPPATNHTVHVTNRTANIYGQVWIDGVTSEPGATPKLVAQLGFGPAGSNALTNSNWKWLDAAFNLDVGNNDEFMATLLPEKPGTYDYLYRYSFLGNTNWLYADLKGPVPAGQAPANPGKLTVATAEDKSAPPVPTGFVVAGTSPSEIKLAWNKIGGDPSFYGYEILRSKSAGGPYTNLARITTNSYTDHEVKEGVTYFYALRSVDHAFNRSGNALELSAAAERSVSVVFNVTVPANTEPTGKSVYIAGTLTLMNGGLLDWDPGLITLSRIDSTHWTITLSGKEGTQFNYKYTLGSWDNVEKGQDCDEITDRQITLKRTPDGQQTVSDTVLNWRNITPCKD